MSPDPAQLGERRAISGRSYNTSNDTTPSIAARTSRARRKIPAHAHPHEHDGRGLCVSAEVGVEHYRIRLLPFRRKKESVLAQGRTLTRTLIRSTP